MKIRRSFAELPRTPWAYRSVGIKREYLGDGRCGYVLGLWWWTWWVKTNKADARSGDRNG